MERFEVIMINYIKRFMLFAFVLVILINGVSAGSVSRSFYSSGEELVVSLNVDISSEDFYVIEEFVPSNWEVSDSGEFDDSIHGRLTLAVLSDAKDITYDYVVKTINMGEYEFDGDYTLGGSSVKNVGGTTKVSVKSSSSGSSSNSAGGAGGSSSGGGESVFYEYENVIDNCIPKLNCTENKCIDGYKEVLCYDENNCQSETLEKVECESFVNKLTGLAVSDDGNFSLKGFIIVGLLVIGAIVSYVVYVRKKEN